MDLYRQDEYLRSPQGKKELKSLKRKANQEVDPQLMGTTAVWKPSKPPNKVQVLKFLVVSTDFPLQFEGQGETLDL